MKGFYLLLCRYVVFCKLQPIQHDLYQALLHSQVRRARQREGRQTTWCFPPNLPNVLDACTLGLPLCTCPDLSCSFLLRVLRTRLQHRQWDRIGVFRTLSTPFLQLVLPLLLSTTAAAPQSVLASIGLLRKLCNHPHLLLPAGARGTAEDKEADKLDRVAATNVPQEVQTILAGM